MTKKEEKWWFENGLRVGKESPNEHPDQIIQEDWDVGQASDAIGAYGGFENWLKFAKTWASGVRKGSKYFENN